MARSKLRIERLQEVIRRDVSEMLSTGLRDPRLRLASVTTVKLTPDMRFATIYVSCLGTDGDKRTFMRGLESATGKIQSVVAKHLRTRVTPRLEFRYDEGIERSIRVSQIIHKALAEDREAQEARGEVPGEVPGEAPGDAPGDASLSGTALGYRGAQEVDTPAGTDEDLIDDLDGLDELEELEELDDEYGEDALDEDDELDDDDE